MAIYGDKLHLFTLFQIQLITSGNSCSTQVFFNAMNCHSCSYINLVIIFSFTCVLYFYCFVQTQVERCCCIASFTSWCLQIRNRVNLHSVSYRQDSVTWPEHFPPPLFLFGNLISLHCAKLSVITNQDSLVAFGIKECFTGERCVDTCTSKIN